MQEHRGITGIIVASLLWATPLAWAAEETVGERVESREDALVTKPDDGFTTNYYLNNASSERIGGTAFHSDGSISLDVGSLTYDASGNRYLRVGGYDYAISGGASKQRVGSTYQHSDGRQTYSW